MASWIIHLRVADILMKAFPALSKKEFIVGNIAPDSGVPNADWSVFSPSAQISHFRTDTGEKLGKMINIAAYTERYFSPNQIPGYDEKQYSFYLGYLVHLLTDSYWSSQIAVPAAEKYADKVEQDPQFFNEIKKDWYDLDFLYLAEHPNFEAFQIYRQAEGFQNTFLDFFSRDAFDNRRQYICNFYQQTDRYLYRDYPYLTQVRADQFVTDCAASILTTLARQYAIPSVCT